MLLGITDADLSRKDNGVSARRLLAIQKRHFDELHARVL